MSGPGVLDPPRVRPRRPGDAECRPAAPARSRRTLDDVVTSAWEELVVRGAATCPVCAGTLTARYGAGAAAVGSRCWDCGAELS